jgi:hypothetical protein
VHYETNISHIRIIVNEQPNRFLRVKAGIQKELVCPANMFFHPLFIKSPCHPVVTLLSKIEIIMKMD